MKQFLKPDEKLLFSKAFDQAFLCENRYVTTFTDFLDPLKAERFSQVIKGNFDVEINSFGGAPGCERRMLSFSQGERLEDFPIEMLEINFSRSAGLTHRDFLGSILGIGISRDKVGDIFVFEKRAIAFLEKSVSLFVSPGLEKVGRTEVETAIIQDDYIVAPLLNYSEKEAYLSSLRLDGVISAGFSLSRSRSLELVQKGRSQINWLTAANPSIHVKVGDNITLRGYGRLEIVEITKGRKENIRIKFRRLG